MLTYDGFNKKSCHLEVDNILVEGVSHPIFRVLIK